MNARREKRREEKKERRLREEGEICNAYIFLTTEKPDIKELYSYTKYIEEKYPIIKNRVIKVLFQDKDFLRVENNRIINLLKVRDLIPEDKLEEVLEYKEFLENLL